MLTLENHKWWWQSFTSSGSSALYVFLFSIRYFLANLHMSKTVSVIMYFGYMSLFSLLFFLFTGSIGTISSFFFCRAIYGSIKVA